MKSSEFFRATLDLDQIFPFTDLCLTPGEENVTLAKLIHPSLWELVHMAMCMCATPDARYHMRGTKTVLIVYSPEE